jgi:hypothetical protein
MSVNQSSQLFENLDSMPGNFANFKEVTPIDVKSYVPIAWRRLERASFRH